MKSTLENMGHRVYQVDMGVLEATRADMATYLETSDDKMNCKQRLLLESYSNHRIPVLPFEVRSLIIVAKRNRAVDLLFEYEGEKKSVIMPPGYDEFHSAPKVISNVLEERLRSTGHSAVMADGLPNKAIAVAAGIAEYGLNGIAYIDRKTKSDGMGSLFQLYIFYTDLPYGSDLITVHHESAHHESAHRGFKMMDRCKSCGKCVAACPTKAIRPYDECHLLHSERCITTYNEKTGDVLPERIYTNEQNAIYGCMDCQVVCPANLGLLEEGRRSVAFSQDETKCLMDPDNEHGMTDGLRQKMTSLDMDRFMQIIPRNLTAILAQNTGTSRVKDAPFPDEILKLPQAKLPFEDAVAYVSQGEDHQILFMHFKKDTILHEHAHEAQWGMVVDGRITITIAGVTKTYCKGDHYHIPSGVKHSGVIHGGYADISFFNQRDRYRFAIK